MVNQDWGMHRYCIISQSVKTFYLVRKTVQVSNMFLYK